MCAAELTDCWLAVCSGADSVSAKADRLQLSSAIKADGLQPNCQADEMQLDSQMAELSPCSNANTL